MKLKWVLFSMILAISSVLAGCGDNKPLLVLDPKGPVAKTQSEVIIFSMYFMAAIVITVFLLYAYMLFKYRASKADKDYEPPHEKGSLKMEILWTAIPIIITIILSVVTVRSTYEVEAVPKGYENEKPLVIYASSSSWKWHFSYPEEGIETVNYVNIPTDRNVEFRLYSYGPISSLWIPQLGGQKYAMSDMITKLRLVADEPGQYMGRNSNFSGEGFAKMEFEALSMTPSDYTEWVNDVKDTAPTLSEDEFNELKETDHVGRKTYSSTHLEFSPPPEGENSGHQQHKGGSDESTDTSDTEDMEDMNNMDHDMEDM